MPAKNTGDEVRKSNVTMTLSTDEREKLLWAAKELGLSLTSFIRMAALKESKSVIG